VPEGCQRTRFGDREIATSAARPLLPTEHGVRAVPQVTLRATHAGRIKAMARGKPVGDDDEVQAYRAAEKEIEKARRSGADRLSLSGYEKKEPFKLAALPSSLRQLTQLRELSLDDNRLTTLPDWFGELTQLQSLTLTANLLTVLPDSLRHLRQLHTLHVDANQLTEMPDWLGELKLIELSLFMNKLTALPNSFSQLSHLKRLSLSVNHFRSFP
jgi:hypothetical protein